MHKFIDADKLLDQLRKRYDWLADEYAHSKYTQGFLAALGMVKSAANEAPTADREMEILYDILSCLKIDDIELSFDKNGLVAKDAYTTWHGGEFYDFLVNEALVYEDDGSVLGVGEELLKDFKKLAAQNGYPLPMKGTLENCRRYIDAGKIQYETPCGFMGCDGDCKNCKIVRKIDIDAIPTVDVQEVVRCKNCKYNEGGFCAHTELKVDDKDFCSRGVKMDNDKERSNQK